MIFFFINLVTSLIPMLNPFSYHLLISGTPYPSLSSTPYPSFHSGYLYLRQSAGDCSANSIFRSHNMLPFPLPYPFTPGDIPPTLSYSYLNCEQLVCVMFGIWVCGV
uniref:Uncharacterized protein n=1 Tax=Cacopsylla melanoneura TaxID=428564 RepID=A0A8D8R352_9HEMI